jgi:hypothetical protein
LEEQSEDLTYKVKEVANSNLEISEQNYQLQVEI